VKEWRVPEGNLTEMAENDEPHMAIGIVSIFWTLWTFASMFIPWQESAHNNTYDAPLWYLFSLTDRKAIFGSWLPTGYLLAWIINIVIFFIEMIAWWIGGMFFYEWAVAGLWGGIFAGAVPWVCEILYIFYEWPLRESGSNWPFIFWSAEFFMIFMQGGLWLISMIVHIVFI